MLWAPRGDEQGMEQGQPGCRGCVTVFGFVRASTPYGSSVGGGGAYRTYVRA